MSDVFNSQSDAILAFQKVDDEDDYSSDCKLNFLFSNIKCNEFFKYDFMQGEDLNSEESMTSVSPDNLIEKKLFTPLDHEQSHITTRSS